MSPWQSHFIDFPDGAGAAAEDYKLEYVNGNLHTYDVQNQVVDMSDEPNEIEENVALVTFKGSTWLGNDCSMQSYRRETEEVTKDEISCFMTFLKEGADARASSAKCDGLLAIVDTACTKTVAGHDWFEQYADWAAEHGYQVETRDRQEHFRFGASKVYVSTFLVRAWFAMHNKFFQAEIAIVPRQVPLLFSR